MEKGWPQQNSLGYDGVRAASQPPLSIVGGLGLNGADGGLLEAPVGAAAPTPRSAKGV